MFGGLAFMVHEHLVACVSGGGGPCWSGWSAMGHGWITIDHDALEEDDDLEFSIPSSKSHAEIPKDTDP